MLRRLIINILLVIMTGCGDGAPPSGEAAGQAQRPNFLIILADDMGYSDIGVMGSEIRTPNIDRLAARGMLMTHFRVHMMCSPTRAMLLTGADSHRAGYGTMAGEYTPEIRNQPGYETYLTDRVTTIAKVLRDGGYHTYIAGKWDMGGHGNPALWPDQRGFDWAEDSFDISLENLGKPDSYSWLDAGWAHVGSTPLRYFKGFRTEGGVRTPAIFSFPGRIEAGSVSSVPANVLDLPVTLLDYAGVEHPGSADNGEPMPALTGRSMRTFLRGDSGQVHPPEDHFAYVIMGRRGVVQGDWKITWMNAPWGPEGRWSLFNLAEDPAERNDLAASHPDKLAQMQALWDDYVSANGVIPIPGYETGWTNRFSHYDWLPPELR